MRTRFWTAFLFSLLLIAPAGRGVDVPLPDKVEFNRDVRPILADTCFKCHGPDSAKRKANLRLDTIEGATADHDGRRAIVPGKPDQSEAVRRLLTHDAEDLMPPGESGMKLTSREVALFRRWVEQGAKYEKHWSLVPPQAAPLPAVKDKSWCRNGIDAFVLARLEREGLSPSIEADKERLIRRVTLDLTGLPPTPNEVDDFLNDASPNAYEKVVDRLLASPRYGERMAADWLDAARYADTSGYQADWERFMWPWRDWVIGAFNSNVPFDRFTVEQVAGDMLPNATQDQKLASGFNRNHRINDEGGIIPAEYAVEYVVDRVDTTAAVWLGLTAGCARCHDHKYDPISQREFYQLFAYFNNVPEKGQDGRTGYAAPFIRVPPPEAKAKIEELHRQADEVERQIATETPASVSRREDWARTIAAGLADRGDGPWHPAKLVRATGTAVELHPQKDGSVVAMNITTQDQSTYDLVVSSDIEKVTALRLQVLTHDTLPDGRLGCGDGNFSLNEVEVTVTPPGGKPKPVKIKIKSASADYEQSGHPAAHAIDGKPGTGWAVDGDILRGERTALFVLDAPAAGKGATWTVRLKQGGKGPQQFMGRVRLSFTAAADPKLGPPDVLPDDVAAALRTDAAARTAEQSQDLAEYFRSIDPERQSHWRQVVALHRSAFTLDAQGTPVMVMQEMPKRRPTYLLKRGQYDQPDKSQPLTPGVPAVLLAPGTKPPANRLEFARWLVSRDNPLTARVAVNRYWQHYFGVGLVKTSEDFGLQGEWPSHPELLDWLAVSFMESGWDVKAMQKRIVTSATYRQSSALPKDRRDLLDRDPENRLLARGPRLRLDAFQVRDNALAAGGLLVEKIGGPSVKPYQPAGLWEELSFGNKTSVDKYVQDHGPNLYRRGLYTFWKRSVPPPGLASFDAAGRETCVVRTARTNTPLQALTLLNDVAYVEAARGLAQRMLTEGGATPADRLTYGWRLTLARRPTAAELGVMTKALARYRAKYDADPAAAKALLAVGESGRDEKLNPSEHAAYTAVANVLLNLDEAITRE